MAKKSTIIKNFKIKNLIKKYSNIRNKYKLELKVSDVIENKYFLNKKIQKLPRDSSPTRLRNRCWKTGRPRGFLRHFGACRNVVRLLAHNCFLAGITKASW
jgi:small subunit ribosomal protein S14